MEASVHQFAAAFAAATGEPAPTKAFAFGDSPELADERARPGELAVVLDGSGAPVGVIRTVAVEVAPFSTVDAAFAWGEGEGDRQAF